jgi:hypothetical integral membrane protein (TIGR02206 family)
VATAVLAACCLTAFPLTQWAWSMVEGPVALDNALPLQLCDLAAFVAGFGLLCEWAWLRLLTYYWGLGATLQALITPAVTFDFPHPVFVVFFIQHFAIVGTALYLPVALGWRPAGAWWRAPWRAFLWSNAYLLTMLLLNPLLGTDFGFVNGPPPNPSLIDHLGPWPYYLLWFQGLAAVIFLVLTVPLRWCGKSAGGGENPVHDVAA